jgi:hypothetical protein
MKKLFFTLFAAGLFLLIFVGCGKDPESDTPPAVQKPDLTYMVTEDSSGVIKIIKLDWNAIRATSCTLNGDTVALSGSKTTDIVENTIFTFVVVGEGGSIEKKVEVKAYLPIITLTATPDTLPIGGGTTTLSWTTQHADSVKYNGVWYAPNGSIETGFIATTSNFTVTVKGKGGEDTSTLTIKVLTQEDIISECLDTELWTVTQMEFCDTLGVSYAIFWNIETDPLCEGDNKLLFTRNPNKVVRDYGYDCNGVYQGTSAYLNVSWSVNGMTILFHTDNPAYNDSECQIDSITKDLFVYSVRSMSLNGGVATPILVRYTLKHL